MTQQIINVGTAINDGTGDPARTAFTKSNDNFTELYTRISSVVVQKFTSSGTYTPTAGMKYCIIECIGSGGGGAGVVSPGVSLTGASGGGGSGGYSRKYASAATIGASQTVTIAAAGNGGAAGNNNGAAGGDVSVGVLCIAKGGSGGFYYQSGVQVPLGGAGGVAGTGDVTSAGDPGGPGFYNAANSTILVAAGNGGSSIMGGGARALSGTVAAGTNASNYGSGGSGGVGHASAVNQAGGNGSAGIVIITEFL